MKKQYTSFLERFMNPVEYKRFGETLQYYLETYKNIIRESKGFMRNIINDFFDSKERYALANVYAGLNIFAGLIHKDMGEINHGKDILMASYQIRLEEKMIDNSKKF